jgi:hypothetical protein
VHLMRDVLDKQLHDKDDCPLGRVDGIVVELRDGKPPRLERIEMGFVVLARRIGRAFERFAERWHKRFGVRRSAHYQVPWTSVREVHRHHISVDVSAEESVAFDWERWVRRAIVDRLPGSEPEEEEKT